MGQHPSCDLSGLSPYTTWSTVCAEAALHDGLVPVLLLGVDPREIGYREGHGDTRGSSRSRS